MLAGSSKVIRRCGTTIMSPCCLKIGLERTTVRFGGTNTDYTARQSRMMKKLITGSNRSRKKFFTVDQKASKVLEEFSFMSSPNGLYKKDKSVPVKPIRRVEVLNTVFMEYITGMMATGDVATQLVGLGIEVTRVKISNDFSCVNVYWAAKGTESDATVEDILEKSSFQLRHECSKLRVVGVVPPIKFVKDKTFSKVMEVETLLTKCDFGEDFVPTASASLFQPPSAHPLASQNGLNPDLTLKIDALKKDFNDYQATTLGEYVDNSIENVQINFSDGSNMRQDILGLKRDRIMETILRGMKMKKEMLLAKEKHCENQNQTREERDDNTEMFTASEVHTEVLSEKKRATDFVNYLKQRKVARAKEMKLYTAMTKEREFNESEKEMRWAESQKYCEEDWDENDALDYEEEIEQTLAEYTKNKNFC